MVLQKRHGIAACGSAKYLAGWFYQRFGVVLSICLTGNGAILTETKNTPVIEYGAVFGSYLAMTMKRNL